MISTYLIFLSLKTVKIIIIITIIITKLLVGDKKSDYRLKTFQCNNDNNL